MADLGDSNAAPSETVIVGDMDLKQEQTIQRIRANSSIMKLKKILGKSPLPSACSPTQVFMAQLGCLPPPLGGPE